VPRSFTQTSDFLPRLRHALVRLSRAERAVARVILDDPACVMSLSLSEMAERSGVAEATVLRMARRLGLSGYQDMRLVIAADRSTDLQTEAVATVSGADGAPGLTAAIHATEALLDSAGVERVAEALDKASLVAIYGAGTSGLAGRYLAYRLTRMGVVAVFEEDTHYQVMGAVLLGAGTVAIAFSQTGSTVSVVTALTAAQNAGALSVAVTRIRHSPLTTAADVTLLTGADETPLLSGALPGVVSQLYVADTIAVATGRRRPVEARSGIQATAKLVANLKF
jgi:DNA-binding MurR/RpiR family transcriptional regulator